jgi:hypothetical protein
MVQWDEREVSFTATQTGAGKIEAMQALIDEMHAAFRNISQDIRCEVSDILLYTSLSHMF